MKKITIVVVDDHKLLREMWVQAFQFSDNIEIVGESGEFDHAIEMIKGLKPDIVLLDINLSPASGLDAVPLIRKFSPSTKIIVVTMYSELAFAKKMFKLGAKAYVTKNSTRQEITNAIEEVMVGKTYVCSEIKDALTTIMIDGPSGEPATISLSVREMEIVQLIKGGLSSKEIAVNLSISQRTAEVHRNNILKKLKLKNTASLVNFINHASFSIN